MAHGNVDRRCRAAHVAGQCMCIYINTRGLKVPIETFCLFGVVTDLEWHDITFKTRYCSLQTLECKYDYISRYSKCHIHGDSIKV